MTFQELKIPIRCRKCTREIAAPGESAGEADIILYFLGWRQCGDSTVCPHCLGGCNRGNMTLVDAQTAAKAIVEAERLKAANDPQCPAISK